MDIPKPGSWLKAKADAVKKAAAHKPHPHLTQQPFMDIHEILMNKEERDKQ